MNNNTLVIAHDADFDGLCSTAIARRALGDSADYLGWDYGRDEPNLQPYTTVYMIDISLSPETMEKYADRIVLVDHHKSCIEKVESFKQRFKGYYCIDGVAACRLAWQFFQQPYHDIPQELLPCKEEYLARNVVEPYAVQLLGRYDVWDKKGDANIDLFQLGLLSEATPNWSQLFATVRHTLSSAVDLTNETHLGFPYLQSIIEKGRTIQAFTEVTNAQIAKERGFDVRFEGLYFRALNIARSNSLTFTAAIRPEHDGCLSYFWDGGKWRFSLYGVEHKKHLDLSVIAKKYGGGGHAQACGGFFTTLPPELGGAKRDLLTIEIKDTPPTRDLLRRIGRGEPEAMEAWRIYIDSLFETVLQRSIENLKQIDSGTAQP